MRRTFITKHGLFGRGKLEQFVIVIKEILQLLTGDANKELMFFLNNSHNHTVRGYKRNITINLVIITTI